MISVTTMAGAVAVMLAVIATAWGVSRFSPFYRRELAVSGNRDLTLDGLRGMAALMVATYHAAVCANWIVTGQWGETGSPLLQLFGPAGVILFFMLTGHLFWTKARAGNGKLPVVKLWRGRLYRIAPLYLFSLLIVILIAAIQTGGHWLGLENWKPLLRLLALGALNWHDIGGVNLGDYNAGVIWTLWYEWHFYLILPFIAWLAVGRRIFGLAPIIYVLAIIGLWFHLNLQPGLFFILGMLCPVLLEDQFLRSRLCQPWAAAVALMAAILLCVLNRGHLLSTVPTISVAGALFPLFLVVAAGNSFLGFLTHPAIRCLGAISFSLYLLHGIVFRLVFHFLKSASLIAPPQLDCWVILTATAIITTLLCAFTYRWIEFPFLSRSHKIAKAAKLAS